MKFLIPILAYCFLAIRLEAQVPQNSAYQEAIDDLKNNDPDDAIKAIQKAKLFDAASKAADPRIAGDPGVDPATKVSSMPTWSSFFDDLHKDGFRLQRTSAQDGATDPATFSYLKDFQNDAKSGFTGAFDLEYKPKVYSPNNEFYLYNHTSAEGLVSTIPKTPNTKWDFSQGLEFWDLQHEAHTVSTFTTVTVKDESDQDFRLNRVSADIDFTPTPFTASDGYIGAPLGNRDTIYLIWRPYLGINAGGVISSQAITNTDQNAAFRFSDRTYAKVVMPFVAKALRLSDFYIFADDTIYFIPESGNARNYLTSGAVFSFTDNISLNLTYCLGQDAPKFESAETFQASLGVKF